MTFKRVSYVVALVLLLVATVAGTKIASKTVSAQLTTPTITKDVVTFECFNRQVFFSSRSANAPALNSSSCAQATADLLNAGFKLRPTNTINFGTLFVLVRSGD